MDNTWIGPTTPVVSTDGQRRVIRILDPKFAELKKNYEELKAGQLKKLKEEADSEKLVFEEEVYKKIHQALEDEFNCSICDEICIEPTVLACSHTFCSHCIGQWKAEGKANCPTCRKYFVSPITKHNGLENFINRTHSVLSKEIRDQRQVLILERQLQVQQVLETESSSEEEDIDDRRSRQNIQQQAQNQPDLSRGSRLLTSRSSTISQSRRAGHEAGIPRLPIIPRRSARLSLSVALPTPNFDRPSGSGESVGATSRYLTPDQLNNQDNGQDREEQMESEEDSDSDSNSQVQIVYDCRRCPRRQFNSAASRDSHMDWHRQQSVAAATARLRPPYYRPMCGD